MPLTVSLAANTSLTINLPFNGILAPASPYTAVVNFGSSGTFTVPVGGTPISGIVPALVNWAPEQLAEAIGKHPPTM